MEEGDSDSDKTVRLEDYHKISRRLSNNGGCVQSALTGMEEGRDSDSDKTVRLEEYHRQPETIPLRRLTEEHGGLVQNVTTAPNEYETIPKAYIPTYELARNVNSGKQLILSRFLDSNFEKLVKDESDQYTSDRVIKRELNQVSDDVRDNPTHTDENIIVIDSSDDEHPIELIDEKNDPSPNTSVTTKNGLEIVDLELTANDTPPPITNVNIPAIRLKVLNPKAINEQAAAKISIEFSNDDKTKPNNNIISSTRNSDGETKEHPLKKLTTLCESNENVSSSSVIQTVAKNKSDKISVSANKNGKETANRREMVTSSTAERGKLPSPENSKCEKGERYAESNRVLNMNVEETRRQVNRLSDKDILPTTCKRMRTDHEESTKNTAHSVRNDVNVDINNHINTNIVDLCTNTHQKNSENADIVMNEQKEKEKSNPQTLKESSCRDNLKKFNEKKSISMFLSRFCSLMMKDLLEKCKRQEDDENKNAFSKSARLLADEIEKLDALEKANVHLNCPVCSRISTLTGDRLYNYYNDDTEGKQQNRFKKCYLCFGFLRKYNFMMRPFLTILSIQNDGAKSFESCQNLVNRLFDNNRNECSVESNNNKNKLENIKHNTSLPESVNKETNAPKSCKTLESKNNISQITDSLTLEDNISTVATEESVVSEKTSIDVHRHPVNVVISTTSTSKHNNDLEQIVDNLKSKPSSIPAIDTNLSKTILAEKLDNVDHQKVENNISKTNIRNNDQGSKLISTTTSVDCSIVKTPVTEPKPIFVEIKGKAKYMPVDRDSRSATLPSVLEKIKKNDANVLQPVENAASEGTNKPVIEKSTKRAYDVNKTLPNNNTNDHRVDNLTAQKRKNKEMQIKPVERSLITRTSDIDLPSTLSNIKANTSKDMPVKLKDDGTNIPRQIHKLFSGSTSDTTQKSSTNVHDVNMSVTSFDNHVSDDRVDCNTTEVKNLSDTVKARRKSKETSSNSVSEKPIGKTPDENLPSLSKDKDHSTYKLGNITTETTKVMPGDRCLSEKSSVPNMAAKSKIDGANQLKMADRLGDKSTLVTSEIKLSSGTENDIISCKTSNNNISDHSVDRLTTEYKSLSDTVKARRNSKEMSGRSVGESSIDRTQGVNLPLKSKNKDHSKNEGTHQLKTADRLGGKSTLASEIKLSSGTENDIISCKTSNNNMSDHSVDRLTAEYKSLSDTLKARRNSKEMSGRSVGENPIDRPQGVNSPLKSKNKDHSNDKLKTNTSTSMSVDRCQSKESCLPNISKDSSGHLKRTGDELLSKGTSIFAIQQPDQSVYDVKISKTSSNVDVSDQVLESKTRDIKVQDKQLRKGVHKRRVSSKININKEDVCNNLQSDTKNKKIGTSLGNPTLSRDSYGVVEERHLTKEKSLLISNILTMTAEDKNVSGGISVGTQDSSSSKIPNSTSSNNNEILNPAVDSVGIEKRDESQNIFIASTHPNVCKITTITEETVHSLVPKSNNNNTNLNISGVHAKTNILPIKASKRRISIDTSVSNIPPKIYKDQIGNTSVLSIPSKPKASKESIIANIPAELKSKTTNQQVITDALKLFEAANIVSTNNPNKNPREGIFINDEASTKIYYNNMQQRVDRVVTEANNFALEAENSKHPTGSLASVPTEAAKCRNNDPTAMSSREKVAKLLSTDEDNQYEYETSKTNKRNIADDDTQTSPKRMKTNDRKIGTKDDVENALSNKAPKNDTKDAMNNSLTLNKPLASGHVETTTKKTIDNSSNVKGHIKSDEEDISSKLKQVLFREVINTPGVHSTAISVSNDKQKKHITSDKGQNTKLTENPTDEESNNLNTNKAKDDHKSDEASIIKKSNGTQKQENKASYETSKNITTLENDNRDRVKKVVAKDSAKKVTENSDGDSANGSVNVKENETNGLVVNSLENRQEKSTTLVEAEAGTLFLERSKKIINSKILYECPICSCIFQESNIFLDHLKSDHNLSTLVVPETVELNNNSNQNDEAESVNKFNNSVTNTEVNVQHEERVSTPHCRKMYIYKCSICKDILHTYYSARIHKREFHPKKKHKSIFESILIDCKTGKQIMDTDHTSADVDDNNEKKDTTENEFCDEDTNSDNDEHNEVRSNMCDNNVVIISDEEAVDEQSSNVEQQKISDLTSSSPGNGSNANSYNDRVECQAVVKDENEQSSSDKANHGHEISFINQHNINKSIDESDANSVNRDSRNGNDMEVEEENGNDMEIEEENGNYMEVEEETREGRIEDIDEEQSHRRNMEPNDDNVIKYGYKCKICNVVCRSKYASIMHRKIKHFQMRNRQLFDKVLLCRRSVGCDQEKVDNRDGVGKPIPIGESSLQSVSIDDHENRTKETAQTEAEDNEQKNKQLNSNQEHQGKERNNESNKTNGDKLHTNNHDSKEKVSNAPESTTHNSHNLVKKICASISHVNQKGSKESSNNEEQINNQIIPNSNDNIVDRQILSSTNFPNKLSSHDPMDNNVDDNVQKGPEHKEIDTTNDNQTVHDSETNNRQTGDEITQNQSDHKIIQTKKWPDSPDAYILTCLECGYTTEICDSVIRHCQNHYNDVKDPTTYCTICQLNFDTDNFETHQNLHVKHVNFAVVKYSYKSLFSDKIFDEIPTDMVKDFRKKSIYKTNCIKMVVTESGPWEDSLYLCGQCNTCMPPHEIERHFQDSCYFVSYPCLKCKRYFTSLEMLVEHEKNHSNSYRVVAFNYIKDKNFNCKLLEARKNQQDLVDKKVLATIYKCACELCFATSNSFKIHFIECDFATKQGDLCSKCKVPLRFQSTELENHNELHLSAMKYKFLVHHVTIHEEKVPDEDGNEDNTKDTANSQLKGYLNTAEIDIKRDLLKHDSTDSQE